jgi:DNA-3-methyladenine glycosylase
MFKQQILNDLSLGQSVLSAIAFEPFFQLRIQTNGESHDRPRLEVCDATVQKQPLSGKSSTRASLKLKRIRRLRRAELPVHGAELARFLIGKILVHDTDEGRLAGRIVETEAYVPGDASSHAFRGETPRNRSLFLKRGHAYVYFTYGSCYCMNVSAELRGVGGGVLLRGLEPLSGVHVMERNRGTTRVQDLARGPGRLAQAMGIDRALDGVDLCRDKHLWLGAVSGGPPEIGVSVRIGISREMERPLRFYERGNVHVSGARRLRE